MSIIPGWHGTIFAPYFVAGAIYSGVGMVLTLIIPLRKVLKLEHMITDYHFDNLAKLTLFTGSILFYAYAMEYFIAWYSREHRSSRPRSGAARSARTGGPAGR